MKKKTILVEIRTAVTVIFVLVFMCCVLYPLVVWGIAQVLFPVQANGSLLKTGPNVIGSVLIAQPFTQAGYFHPRPSAANYDALTSGGSNIGPLSAPLFKQVATRVAIYRAQNHLLPREPVPVDAVTASASGLDPHISLENARLQANRVAQARGISAVTVQNLIAHCTEHRQLGLFGEQRVNVLLLNRALEKIK